MKFLHVDRRFWMAFIGFITLNTSLYFFIMQNHSRVPFNKSDYIHAFHHFIPDTRVQNKPFNLFNALGQADAQWYLKIAAKGYPKNPKNLNIFDKKEMDGLMYGFFPFYPLILYIFNFFFRNIEVTAFILANMFMLINFISIYFVIRKIYSVQIAMKVNFLLFVFPFSIFFRSYFAEGLFLLLLIWFSWYFINQRWIESSILLGLLMITKGNAMVLLLIFLYYFWKAYRKSTVSTIKFIWGILLISLPTCLWQIYCYIQTGDPFFYLKIRTSWVPFFNLNFPLFTIINNFYNTLAFIKLPLNYFYLSKIDTLTVYVVLYILLKSKKILTKKLWLISLSLWLTPLLFHNTMSFTRYQSYSFPIYIYLAHILNGNLYKISICIMLLGLLVTSIYFINWYWVG